MMRKWSAALLCLGLVCSSAGALHAQGKDASREAQLKLSDQGVELMSKADYKGAIKKFEEALAKYGSLDLIHLNLGRALYRDGQCLESEQQYLKVLDPKTPRLGGEITSDMDSAVRRFLTELNQTCPGYLKISCDPPEIQVYLNGEGPKRCDGALMPVEPGKYEIVGEIKGQRTKPQVQVIERMQKASVQLSMTVVSSPVVIKKDPKTGEPTEPGITAPLDPPPVERSKTSAWIFVGAGAAAIVGGLFWDTCGFSYFSQSSLNAERNKVTPEQFKNQTGWCYHTVNSEVDVADAGPLLLYVGGAVLSTVGILRF